MIRFVPSILLHSPSGRTRILYNPDDFLDPFASLPGALQKGQYHEPSTLFEERGRPTFHDTELNNRSRRSGLSKNRDFLGESWGRTSLFDAALGNGGSGGVRGRVTSRGDSGLPLSKSHLRRKQNLRHIDEQEEVRAKETDSGAENNHLINEEEKKSPLLTIQQQKVWRSWGWEYLDDEK